MTLPSMTTVLTDSPDTLAQHDFPSAGKKGRIPSGNRGPSTATSRAYREAKNLYLTRRLREALDVLEPVVSGPTALATASDNTSGNVDSTRPAPAAPVAATPAKVRIRVWNLYLTLVDAAIELGHETGHLQLGRDRWKTLAAQAQDGSIWNRVVQQGYNGVASQMDPEVVSSLATLLISHAPSQNTTQQYLERYLAAAPLPQPSIEIPSQSDTASFHSGMDASFMSNHSTSSVLGTPRSLQAHQHIIELYTLHVLPRNDEWDFAKQFLEMSDHLDEEKREELLHSLEGRRDEDREAKEHAAYEAREAPRASSPVKSSRACTTAPDRPGRQSPAKATGGAVKENRQPDRGAPRSGKVPSKPALQPSKAPQGRPRHQSSSIALFRQWLASMAQSLSHNPGALLKALLLLLTCLATLSRSELRARLWRIIALGLVKLRQTMGMAMQISYA